MRHPSCLLLCLQPVLPAVSFCNQRNCQSAYPLHLLGEQGFDTLRLVFRTLDDEFIVNLHDQTGGEPFLLQPLENLDHGKLDDIGGSTLDRHVECYPLPERPGSVFTCGDLREGTAAAEDRLCIPCLSGLLHHILHVPLHSRESGEIGIHVCLCLLGGDTQILRQGKGGDPVDDSKVHRFGRPAHGAGNLIQRYAKDVRGGDCVEILPGAERLLHGFIAGDVRQKPQLDLAVIGVYQDTARSGNEHSPQLAPQLCAGGDVLQVGFCGTEPPGGGDGHLEIGVDPFVWADSLQESVHVSAAQLHILPVLQDIPDDGVIQLLQYLRIGGPSSLRLFTVGKAQPLKEDLSQLLRRVDVEFPGISVDPLFQLPR